MTDRLNELNDKIIENLEKQVSNYEKVIEFDNTTISNLSNKLERLEKALEVAQKYFIIISENDLNNKVAYPEMLLSRWHEKLAYAKEALNKINNITQALEKEEK